MPTTGCFEIYTSTVGFKTKQSTPAPHEENQNFETAVYMFTVFAQALFVRRSQCILKVHLSLWKSLSLIKLLAKQVASDVYSDNRQVALLGAATTMNVEVHV